MMAGNLCQGQNLCQAIMRHYEGKFTCLDYKMAVKDSCGHRMDSTCEMGLYVAGGCAGA